MVVVPVISLYRMGCRRIRRRVPSSSNGQPTAPGRLDAKTRLWWEQGFRPVDHYAYTNSTYQDQ